MVPNQTIGYIELQVEENDTVFYNILLGRKRKLNSLKYFLKICITVRTY